MCISSCLLKQRASQNTNKQDFKDMQHYLGCHHSSPRCCSRDSSFGTTAYKSISFTLVSCVLRPVDRSCTLNSNATVHVQAKIKACSHSDVMRKCSTFPAPFQSTIMPLGKRYTQDSSCFSKVLSRPFVLCYLLNLLCELAR